MKANILTLLLRAGRSEASAILVFQSPALSKAIIGVDTLRLPVMGYDSLELIKLS